MRGRARLLGRELRPNLAGAADMQGSFADFLLAALESERAARQERVRQALLKIATLPAIKEPGGI